MKTKIVYTMAIVIICTSLASCQPPQPYYENPYKNSQYWYKGNTHTHTEKSGDADFTSQEVANFYASENYDFIVLSDHNQVNMDEVQGIQVLRGCESGDWYDHHLTAVGVESCPSECKDCTVEENQERIDYVSIQNGIVILNHPGTTSDENWPAEDALQVQGFHAIEISDSEGDFDIWFYLLNHGQMVWGVASDDFHSGSVGERGWIIVNSSLDTITPDDVMENINNGNFYSVVRGENSNKAFFPELFTINPIGNNVAVSFKGASFIRFFDCWGLLESKFIGDQGVTSLESYIPNQGANLRLPQGYLRVELEDQTGNIAYSQPLHVIGVDACPNMPAPPPPTPTCSTGYHRCGIDCYPNDMECP